MFSETALFLGIHTDLLYQYCFLVSHFPVSLNKHSLNVLTFTMLSFVTCLISPDPRHAITWHSTWHTWLS